MAADTMGATHRPSHGAVGAERRKAPRLRCCLACSLGAFDGTGLFSSVKGETVDIATGGCRVRTAVPIDMSSDPTVDLHLPGGDEVIALARIVGVEPQDGAWEYRLVFAEIDDADVAHIALVVATANPTGS